METPALITNPSGFPASWTRLVRSVNRRSWPGSVDQGAGSDTGTAEIPQGDGGCLQASLTLTEYHQLFLAAVGEIKQGR